MDNILCTGFIKEGFARQAKMIKEGKNPKYCYICKRGEGTEALSIDEEKDSFVL